LPDKEKYVNVAGAVRRFFAMLQSRMARRPDSEKHEKLTQKDLDELRYNLTHLSVDAVRRFYDRAYEDCRLIYSRLPSPKQMQTLVQIWRQLWKRR
jgi:hypothetical protein